MTHRKDCYLWGRPATTRDHVPPKTLFPGPRPENLITLPSCERCNKAYSLDEEYFRNNVSMLSNPEHAAPIWKAAHRSLKRSPKLDADTMRRLSVTDSAGIRLPVLRYDAMRTNRVLVKIAHGLVYHHTGRRLPDSVRTEAFPVEDVPNSLKELTPKLPFRGRWQGVFAYTGGMSADDPDTGVWLFAFYVSRAFLVHFDSQQEPTA